MGVPVQRRPRAHLRYLGPGYKGGARALALGFSEPDRGHASRIARLREHLKTWPSLFRLAAESHGLSADDLQSTADLRHFPDAWAGIAWARAGRCRRIRIGPDGRVGIWWMTKAAGSSGKAIPVLRDGYDQLHMWAALRFWRERLK